MGESIALRLRQAIREVPDFPKAGINFYDITTVLKDGALLQATVQAMAVRYRSEAPALVVGIEARGFIFGGALAQTLGVGFVPMRKPGKLPAAKESICYELEYGTDSLEIHKDAINPGAAVLIVDDLLATGGTTKAAVALVEKCGGRVRECAFVVELGFLNGREKLSPVPVVSLLQYS